MQIVGFLMWLSDAVAQMFKTVVIIMVWCIELVVYMSTVLCKIERKADKKVQNVKSSS